VVVLGYEVLADACDLAAAFSDAAALPGWLPQERAALETASTAIWKAIWCCTIAIIRQSASAARNGATETRIAPAA
jgi:hypothetical protein